MIRKQPTDMNKTLLIILTVTILALPAWAGMNDTETALCQTFDALRAADSDSAIIACNEQLCELMVTATNDAACFDYGFDNVWNMGKVYSDDLTLRIFSWNYRLSDGSYGYEAFFVQKKKSKLLTKHLSTKSAIKPSEKRTYSAKDWYGSLYYNAFAYKNRYILLGYSMYTDITKVKVIDVLDIDGNSLTLGEPVFLITSKPQNRCVFEYSSKANMNIEYDPAGNRFVFDHLSPSEPAFEGVYTYYGPDFTYDAVVSLKKKLWKLVSDIDIKNQE